MSSSENEIEMKKGRRRTRLKPLSSGNFMCLTCERQFSTKCIAYKHTRRCKGAVNGSINNRTEEEANTTTCKWCGIEFKNRGNLASHAFHIHGDSSYKAVVDVAPVQYSCTVCNKSFKISRNLRYHIRNIHFNLRAAVPQADLKQVNQVWFEKVLNTNKILEIKKTGQNTLVMKTLHDNANVNTVNPKIIDLNYLYPTKDKRTTCEFCNKSLLKRDYKKHIEETHLNKKKHSCNNCNRTFKRAYQYLQHRCDRILKVRGVKQGIRNKCDGRIASVESLSMPLGVS